MQEAAAIHRILSVLYKDDPNKRSSLLGKLHGRKTIILDSLAK
jgi:hypothetical protein